MAAGAVRARWDGIRSALFAPSTRPIWALLLVGLVLRLWLAYYVGNASDLRTNLRWSDELAHHGSFHFYETSFKDYLPVYLYILGVIGLAARWFNFSDATWFYALKLPSIVADLASAYLLYRLLEDRPLRSRFLAAASYIFLPTALLDGALWGQVDSLLALALLGCVYFMSRGKPVVAAVTFTLAFLLKPLALGALPILVFWGLRDYKPRIWIRCFVASLVVILVVVWPFFPDHPWGIIKQTYDSSQTFRFNSSFAYNLFGAFGWFRDDSTTTLYIKWWQWGILLTALAQLAVVYSLRNARGPGMMALGVALSMLVFFTFSTRMHERYMFATFLPLLAACFYLDRPVLSSSFVWLSIVQFFAMYRAFFYVLFNPGDPAWLYARGKLVEILEWSPGWWNVNHPFVQFVLSCFVVMVTLALIVYAFLLTHRVRIDRGIHIEPVSDPDELRLGRDTTFG